MQSTCYSRARFEFVCDSKPAERTLMTRATVASVRVAEKEVKFERSGLGRCFSRLTLTFVQRAKESELTKNRVG